MAGLDLDALLSILVPDKQAQEAIAGSDPYIPLKQAPDLVSQVLLQNAGNDSWKTSDKIVAGLLSGLGSGLLGGASTRYQNRASNAYEDQILHPSETRPSILSQDVFDLANRRRNRFDLFDALRTTDNANQLDAQVELDKRKSETDLLNKIKERAVLGETEMDREPAIAFLQAMNQRKSAPLAQLPDEPLRPLAPGERIVSNQPLANPIAALPQEDGIAAPAPVSDINAIQDQDAAIRAQALGTQAPPTEAEGKALPSDDKYKDLYRQYGRAVADDYKKKQIEKEGEGFGLGVEETSKLARSGAVINESQLIADTLEKSGIGWLGLRGLRNFSALDKQGIGIEMKNLMDQLTRARTGAQLNAEEQTTYDKMIGGDITADPKIAARLLRKLAASEARLLAGNLTFRQELNSNPQALLRKYQNIGNGLGSGATPPQGFQATGRTSKGRPVYANANGQLWVP